MLLKIIEYILFCYVNHDKVTYLYDNESKII